MYCNASKGITVKAQHVSKVLEKILVHMKDNHVVVVVVMPKNRFKLVVSPIF